MKTKSFFRLFFVGALAIMALSCNKEQPKEKGFDVAQFAVQMSEITAVSANAQVTVTENMDAPWYGFVTTDLESKAEDVVDEVVSKLSVGWDILNTGNKSVPVENLIPGGFNYRYIVTGLAPDGRAYGTPAEVNFRTVMDYSVNPAWSVNFIGTVLEEGVYLTYYEVSGLEEGGYFGYIVVSAEDYNTYGAAEIASKDAETIIRAGAVSESIFDEDDYYSWDALTPGDYYFIMYGVDKDYNPTMKYIAQPFTVEAATDAYESYVGTWYSADSKMFTVEEETINQSYLFCGDLYSYFEDGYITFYFESAGSGYYQIALDKDGNVLPLYDMLAAGTISEDGKTITFEGAENVAAVTIAEYTQKGWKKVIGAPVLPLPLTVSSEEPTPTEAYSAWLGTWYNDAGEEFEIEQGIINNSVILKGFFKDEGETVDLTATIPFDQLTGSLVFSFEINDEYQLYALDQDGYSDSGDDGLLAYGVMNEDGHSFTIEGIEYDHPKYGHIIISAIVKYEIESNLGGYFDLPFTLYDAIPEPSEEYLAWIGDWNIVRVPEISHEATQDDIDAGDATEIGEIVIDQEEVVDTWTISEGKMNTTYAITGIEGTPFEVIADFDKETGALSIAEQTVYSLENAAEENVFTVYLWGTLYYYGLWGFDATVMSAVIDEKGDAVVTPESLYGIVDFVDFGLYAQVGVDDTMAYSYSYNQTPLPNVMTPCGEAEVTAKAASTYLPLNINEWTKNAVKRADKEEVSKYVGTKASNSKQSKQKEAFKPAQKQGKSLKGEAPQGTGKRDKKGPAYGGGKRGKLNQ